MPVIANVTTNAVTNKIAYIIILLLKQNGSDDGLSNSYNA